MLALAEYKASICPVCGGPIDECTDPKNEGKFISPPPTRCHRQTALLIAQQDIEKRSHPGALLFTAHLRD